MLNKVLKYGIIRSCEKRDFYILINSLTSFMNIFFKSSQILGSNKIHQNFEV